MKYMSGLSGMRWVTLLVAFVLMGFTTVITLLTSHVYAATGTMYLTGTSSATHGANVTLNLRINPGTAVTVTQSSITYDATKLQFVSINTSGSAFDTNITQSQSSGSIEIDRALLTPSGVSTDSLIATITFIALPYSGSTAVNLVPPSNAAYNGSYTNPALSGATVNFTPGSCPSGQTGTPPNCTTAPSSGGSGGGTSSGSTKSGTSSTNSTSVPAPVPTQTPAAPTSSLAAPTITSTDFQYTIATIAVTTNIAAQVQVKYGLNADSLNFQTALTQSGTKHTIAISDNLAVASTIYYQLVATDGITTKTSETQTAKTKGLVANILLLDKNRKALAGQTVSIVDEKATSNKDGYVTFSNLTPGEHQVELKGGSKTYKESFTILANITTENGKQTTPQQNIFLIFRGYIPTSFMAALPYVAGGTVVIAAVAGGIIYRRRYGGFGGRKMTNVPIEGLIVGGQGAQQAPIDKTPFDEPAYNPFAPNDSPPGSGK